MSPIVETFKCHVTFFLKDTPLHMVGMWNQANSFETNNLLNWTPTEIAISNEPYRESKMFIRQKNYFQKKLNVCNIQKC